MEENKTQKSFLDSREHSASTAGTFTAKKKMFWQYSGSLNVGLVIIFFCLVFAFFPQYFAPYPPNVSNPSAMLKPPSAEHFFGTDNYGRDIFSRVVWGTRYDIAMGFLAMLVPFIFGTIIGIIAGYYGGWLDALLMRILDIVMAFPFILLTIVIIAILGPGLFNLFVAIWLVGWRDYARLVRSEVIVVKHNEYIQAAQVLGFSNLRILLGHVLPNVINSAITFAASDVVLCMLAGASMSFLGLGAQPPTPEWGALISSGRPYLTQAWWICTFPGLAICLAGIGFSLFGEGVGDLIRTKGR